MSLMNYDETKADENCPCQRWVDEWKALGVPDNDVPKFEDFQNFTVKSRYLSAHIGYNKKGTILCLDHIDNQLSRASPRYRNDQVPPGTPRISISELIKQFCNTRGQLKTPKFLVIGNVVEAGIWKEFGKMSSGGRKEPNNKDFGAIKGTKFGRLAVTMGTVRAVHIFDLERCDFKKDPSESFDAPDLVFIY